MYRRPEARPFLFQIRIRKRKKSLLNYSFKIAVLVGHRPGTFLGHKEQVFTYSGKVDTGLHIFRKDWSRYPLIQERFGTVLH